MPKGFALLGAVIGLMLDFVTPVPELLLVPLRGILDHPFLGEYPGLSVVVHATAFFAALLLLPCGLGYLGYYSGSRLDDGHR